MTSRGPVMVVDDDADLRASLSQMLTLAGYEVSEARDGAEALRALSREFAGPIVSDIRMPGVDGIELLEAVCGMDPELPVILLTGHGDVAMAVDALKSGAWDFLTKPFDPHELEGAVSRAADKRRLVMENRQLKAMAGKGAETSPIIGHSAAIEQVRQTLAALAPTPIDLLIEGESGTGKELAARVLHHDSRNSRRFVVLPCAGITEAMTQDRLFAPDGPIADAQGGTLFIDDLHRAGPLLQSRLAEFAETRQLGTLDRDQALSVACRVITTVAHHDDLAKIDPALLYRVSSMRITLPPLRERREDIPLLLTHFLGEAAQKHGREPIQPDRSTLDWAAGHRWPGNVRELENLAERMILGLETSFGVGEQTQTLPERLEAFERNQIIATLAASGGSVAKTIERLGIPRKTFYYKANKLGIDPAQFRGD